MAKKMYIGVANKARKGKKLYFGVSNKARKVKKGYIGVAGKARPFWTGGELAKYGSSEDGAVDALSTARSALAAIMVGNYALFGGGWSYSNIVDVYDGNLAHTVATPLPVGAHNLAAGAINNHALFAGGDISGYGNVTSRVCAYDLLLTQTTLTGLARSVRRPASANAGYFLLFGGGKTYRTSDAPPAGYFSVDTVSSYDSALTRTTPTPLTVAREELSGISVQNFALFAGGQAMGSSQSWNPSKVVEAYNSDLTQTVATPLDQGRSSMGAASVGSHAIFVGGVTSNTAPLTNVDIYDANLTHTTGTPIPSGKAYFTGVSGEDFALFGGGRGPGERDKSDIVYVYNEDLTRTTATSLSVAREGFAATTVGSFILFAGGATDNTSDVVDVYVV